MAKVYLFAGHHNSDPGAVSNGFKENRLTQELRNLILKKIQEVFPGIEIVSDNDSDTLAQVIAKTKATATADDILIEIHFDAVTGTATGTTALVANDARMRSRQIAEDLAVGISGTLGIRNRGVKSESDSQHSRLGILHTKASSVLIEICFIDNSSDMQKYTDRKECLAKEIALIILKHLYATKS